MAQLIKTVRYNGGGDYTDLVTGINSILSSGVAATGYYTEYILDVDSGLYSGAFSANVPYSGSLYIKGSGTWFVPSGTCYISGISPYGNSNVEFSNFTIRSIFPQYVFSVYSGAAFSIQSLELIRITNGIINSGILHLDNASVHGLDDISGGCFIRDYGSTSISSSRISHFQSGIYSKNIAISDTTFIDNRTHIIGYNSGVVNLAHTLIYGGISGIVFQTTPTGELYIYDSTIDTTYPIIGSGITLDIDRTIIRGANYCVYGPLVTGVVSNSCLYPASSTSSLTQSNVINQDPKFNRTADGDYRLKLRQVTGSPCINLVDPGILSGSVSLYTEQAQMRFFDNKGTSLPNAFLPYIYKQGNTLLLSDYLKEISFANEKRNYSSLNYSVEMQAKFEASGVPITSAINLVNSPFPYDWDYKIFSTPEITDRHRYIIPRSIADITQTISPFLGSWLNRVNFGKLNTTHISPSTFSDYRGVGFDYCLSFPGKAVVWMVEGLNQMLIQLNAYTGERFAEYPLFTQSTTPRPLIKPSGLVFLGVEKDQYKYTLESDPTVILLSKNRDGYFDWIYTQIDSQKDARGVLAYKDHIYLTATEYKSLSITDRTTVPVYNGSVGKLIRYDNNNTFEHYIANYTSNTNEPSSFILNTGNCYPMDLTVYEDGRFVISDWTRQDVLFTYKLAYDYALVQSSYDTETRILLRENYDNVEL